MCYFDLEREGSANGAGGRGHTAMFPNEAPRVTQHIFSQQGVWSSGWSVKADFLLLLLLLLSPPGRGRGGPCFYVQVCFQGTKGPSRLEELCVRHYTRGETIDTHLTPLQVCWDSEKRTWRSNG